MFPLNQLDRVEVSLTSQWRFWVNRFFRIIFFDIHFFLIQLLYG